MIPTIPRRYIGLDLARRAATLGMIALLLYGTWYGLVRWIDTLPDPGQIIVFCKYGEKNGKLE